VGDIPATFVHEAIQQAEAAFSRFESLKQKLAEEAEARTLFP